MIDRTTDPLPTLPTRSEHSHKGDYGRGLVVGGSVGMAGAPAMTAMACLRSGAGLVAAATPRCIQPTVAGYHPAYTTLPLADDGECVSPDAVETLQTHCDSATAIAFGPGMGSGHGVNEVLTALWRRAQPIVIDADGLNALASLRRDVSAPAGARILTPHAGEFARLAGDPLSDPDDDQERVSRSATLAKSFGPGTIVLLKGARSVVTDGDQFALNATGNPGMATGGAGDVLTGVILGLLCQGLDAFAAARLGAYVHGLAGDLAAAKLGPISLTATDLIDALPEAWTSIAK